MMAMYLVLIFSIFCVSLHKAENLTIGNAAGGTLTYLENVKLNSIPFTTRVKNVFFSSPNNQNLRAVSAIDLNKSKGKATVTAGGVGSTFVNIKIKSERGEGLNYQVQIFV